MENLTTGNLDKEYYMKTFNPESVDKFWKLGGRIEEHAKNKGWKLYRKNNQRYIAFKCGRWIVFGLHFHSNDCFHIFFKVTPDMVSNIEISDDLDVVYGKHPKQLMYYFPASRDVDINLFDELFEAAYENIVG
jgi:hypothetical protein